RFRSHRAPRSPAARPAHALRPGRGLARPARHRARQAPRPSRRRTRRRARRRFRPPPRAPPPPPPLPPAPPAPPPRPPRRPPPGARARAVAPEVTAGATPADGGGRRRSLRSLPPAGEKPALEIAGPVRVAAGPWRLEEEWWSDSPVDRAYWDVELESGGLYR